MVIESYDQHYTPDIEPVLLEEARTVRAVSQVCQLWRDVSFGCHRIWGTISNVDSSSTFWIRELLQRSSSATLAIQSKPRKTPKASRSFDSPQWTLISEQTHRFRKLNLTLQTHDFYTSLPIFGRPVPLLESLILKLDLMTKLEQFCRSRPKQRELPLPSSRFLFKFFQHPSVRRYRPKIAHTHIGENSSPVVPC